MAGDWIKMRTDLSDDPAVFRIATMTKLDRFAVIGRLHAFWAWADRHSVDGRVDGASSIVVDDVTRCDGFSVALEVVGWLIVDEKHVEIPHHALHNGASAKERAMKNARQSRWRSRQDANVDASPFTTPSTSPSTPPSTREEKRREERESKKRARTRRTPPTPLPEGFTVSDAVRAWAKAKGMGNPDDHLDAFVTKCQAKDYRYVDWDRAFMGAIRDDWARLRTGTPAPAKPWEGAI